MNKIIHFKYEDYLDNEPNQSNSYWINRDILNDILFHEFKLTFLTWSDNDKLLLKSTDDSLLNLLILKHSKYIIRIENEE